MKISFNYVVLYYLDLTADIRNLIDAVEEHSDQFIREATVSNLIDVKKFFVPLLTTEKNLLLSKFISQVSSSTDIANKVFDTHALCGVL